LQNLKYANVFILNLPAGDVTDEHVMDEICSAIPADDDVMYFIPSQRYNHLAKVGNIQMSEFQRVFAVNAISPLILIQKLAGRLGKAGGRVLLPVTPAEAFPQTGWCCYGLSKIVLEKIADQCKVHTVISKAFKHSIYNPTQNIPD
jgi:NAD(P)-dependent dehydrogenase (short-subunit alcohol dehydrogenase family)